MTHTEPFSASDDPETQAFLDTLPRKLHEAPLKWAADTPDGIAISDPTRRLTYAELGAAILAAAARLVAYGVRPGDRVAVINENGVTSAVLIYAVSAAGAIASPINARVSPREVAVMLGHLVPRCILYATDSAAAATHAEEAGAAPETDPVIGQFAIGALNNEAVPETGDLPAVIMFTSGTTGRPKGVVLGHLAILYQGASQVVSRNISTEDTLYIVAPISHAIGLGSNLITAAIGGAEAMLAPRFSPEALAHAIAEDRISFMVAVPQIYAKLLDYADAHGIDLSQTTRLRFTGTGGSPVDLSLMQRMKSIFGLPFRNGYGCTEMTPIAHVPDGVEASGDAIGIASPGCEVKVVRADGSEAADDEVGELWARGPSRMDGYYKDPEATAATITPDGWLRTGDMARRDAEGSFYIVGRGKELIIRSGFNVYPVEVEGVLNAFPGVMQSAVVGRKVPGDEEVVGYVQAAAGVTLDLDALRQHCRENLSGYKVPIELIQEDLPIGPTGKILKSALAARFAS